MRAVTRAAVKICFAGFGLALLYVLFDYAIDVRPPGVQDSYRFEIGPLPGDRPKILRRDNLSILIVRRSADTVARLQENRDGLQDPQSRSSRQPEYATNILRSRTPEYFVAYGIGTDLGCGLEVVDTAVKEICGSARYDFAGRALAGKRRFQNLAIPDYNFSDDYRYLTIRP